MTNQRRSMETQPIPVAEDSTIVPTNPQEERKNHFLEGPLISITVE